jgi:hypothetical protein
MADATNILKNSPAQVSIYDSTNDVLFLGYLNADNLKFMQRSLVHKTIEGNRVQYGARTSLTCLLMESDPSKLAALETRRATKQTVYITGYNFGVKISNCYVSYFQDRDFKPGGLSLVRVEFHTEVEADVEVYRNLLGSDGGFETGAAGLGTGWSNSGMSAVSLVDPSFLNGAGNNHQSATADDDGDYISYTLRWPFDQPVKLTFSVYGQSGAANEDFTMIIRTLDTGGSQITLNESSNKSATSGGTDRFSYSVDVSGEEVEQIELRLKATESGEMKYDDAQLEFGPLSTYTEND